MKYEGHKQLPATNLPRAKFQKREELVYTAAEITSATASTNWTFRACLTKAFVNRWQTPALSSIYEEPLRRPSASLLRTKCLAHANWIKLKYTICCAFVSGIFCCFTIFDEIKEDERCTIHWYDKKYVKGLVGEPDCENVSIGGTTLLKWVLHKQNVMMCAGFVWVRTEISGEHLWTQSAVGSSLQTHTKYF